MRYLITGLPRSRTAWFAQVTGALHEPISHLGYEHFTWLDGEGVSDSGAGMDLARIMDDFSPRTLIVERPVIQVMGSFLRYLGKAASEIDQKALVAYLHDLKEAIDAVHHPLIKRVAYANLTDLGVMHECMTWLGVRPRNLAQSMHMIIESSVTWNMAELRKRVT